LPAPSAESIENEGLRVLFSGDGSIRSVYDKEAGRELVPANAPANVLRVYHDRGDAWDFHPAYRETPSDRMTLVRARPFTDGPVVGLVQEYAYGKSVLRQRIGLAAGSRRLTFETDGVWKTGERMLRVEFPTSVRATAATCDIQFGCLDRPAHANTSWDLAKDEMPAQQWVDLSEPGYGVALINDGKYGHRAKDGVLELTLLRSVSYPRQDPRVNRRTRDGFDHRYTDQRDFRFTYALYPHAGNAHAGRVDQEAAALNAPLRCVRFAAPRAPSLPPSGSFVSVSAPNVAVSCVKPAEDGRGLIVRLYEREGTATRARVALGFDHGAVRTTDLLETPERNLRAGPRGVDLSFRPFEIVTLRIDPR
jgi:alpha-mannosidase